MSFMENYSDEQLIDAYLKGDKESLGVLFGRYLKLIYSFVFRYINGGPEAEDITQEVFVKAWRSLKKFDQSKSFKIWLFAIAKNTAIDFFKKKKTILFSDFENEEGENILENNLVDPSPLPQEILEKADMAKMVNEALDKLSVQYRMVMFLRYNDHFNFREIADVLNEPLYTVKSRHRRALIKLKEILSKKD